MQNAQGKKMEQKGLTTRQHALKNFLKDNFVSGKFFSIKEICNSVVYSDGSPCYEYDDRETTHDHCVALGNDVRAINECLVDGWKLIIKDKKGGVKLAESKEEFETWWNAEAKKVDDRKVKLNMMLSKAQEDGLMPIINKAGNPVDTSKDLKPIETYMKVEKQEPKLNGTLAFIDLVHKVAYIVKDVWEYTLNEETHIAYVGNKTILDIYEVITMDQLERPFYEDYRKETLWNAI